MVLMVAWGCGGGAPSVSGSKSEATVKGTVTINGKLASSGTVIFDPSNTERRDVGPVNAAIGKDGGYSLKTLVGANVVTVSGKDLLQQAPEIQFEKLTHDVQGGENTFDIALPSKR